MMIRLIPPMPPGLYVLYVNKIIKLSSILVTLESIHFPFIM